MVDATRFLSARGREACAGLRPRPERASVRRRAVGASARRVIVAGILGAALVAPLDNARGQAGAARAVPSQPAVVDTAGQSRADASGSPTPARPAAARPSTPDSARKAGRAARIWTFLTSKRFEKGSILTGLLAALAFVGAKGWDYLFGERAATRAARRKFWESVSVEVATLARESYWGLANYAGVLAAQLEEYHELRTYHLLLQWDDHADLERRLDEIADSYRATSFCFFCRVIKLFNDFQFERSNTYLLTSQWSGEMARKLYNQFVEAIDRDDEQQRIDTLKILSVMKTKDSENPERTLNDLPVDDFNRRVAEVYDAPSARGLRDVRDAYGGWLRQDPSKVLLVAQSLRAYSELLHHELAMLYEDWLVKRRGGRDELARTVAMGNWPNVLSVDAFFTIDRARSQGVSLRPIGRVRKQREVGAVGSGKRHAQRGKRDGNQSSEGVGMERP